MSSSEDEEWKEEEEKIPGFEHLNTITSIDMPDDNHETIVEYFVARDPSNKDVVIIKVDHDAEESVELSGSDCDQFRTKLCALKGIDAALDKETASVVFMSEVGEIPTALEKFDKPKKAGKTVMKRIVESDNENSDNEAPKEKKCKTQAAPQKKEAPKEKKDASPKKEEVPTKKAVPKKKKPKKQESKEVKKAASTEKKEEKHEVEKKEHGTSVDAPAKAQPVKKKPAPKRKRVEESILNYVVKTDETKDATTFDWQLTLNGRDFKSLKTALAALP